MREEERLRVSTWVTDRSGQVGTLAPALAGCLGDGTSTMTMRFFGAFGPEAIAEMTAVLDIAFEEQQDSGEPDVVRERIATRIIAAARAGERDPARLLEATRRS